MGAEYRVTNVRMPILSIGKLVKTRLQVRGRTDWLQNVEIWSQCDVGREEKSLWVHAKAYTTIDGARNAGARRLVAPVVDGLPEELPSSSGPDHAKL